MTQKPYLPDDHEYDITSGIDRDMSHDIMAKDPSISPGYTSPTESHVETESSGIISPYDVPSYLRRNIPPIH